MRQLKISKNITNIEDRSLKIYLQEIRREDLISMYDEYKLSKEIKKGNRQALDRLVKANLRFVFSVAKQYQNFGLDLPDLIAEGNLGLIKAAETFDAERNFKFVTYAIWWIRASIMNALSRYSSVIRIPQNITELKNKIKRVSRAFEQINGYSPSIDELAEELDIPLDKVFEAFEYIDRENVSIDARLDKESVNSLHYVMIDGNMIYISSQSADTHLVDGEAHSLLDIMIDDDSAYPDEKLVNDSLSIDIDSLLASSLCEREYEIIKLFFGIGCDEMLLEEIGDKFGITRERARQIKEHALRKLRLNPVTRDLMTGIDNVALFSNQGGDCATKSAVHANKENIEGQGNSVNEYTENDGTHLISQELIIAAYNGDAEAQYALGSSYERSQSVYDLHYSLKWYQKSANQGYTKAQERLYAVQRKIKELNEENYRNNFVKKKATPRKRETLIHETNIKVNDAGIGEQINNGTISIYTINSSIDDLMEGVANGNATAQYILGWDYCFGMFVKKDYEKAMKFLLLAANQNHGFAQFYVGQMYERGYGVAPNTRVAIMWYKKAANQGVDAAISRLKNMKE